MHRLLGIVFPLLMALLSSSAYSEIYRWVDAEGNVHYGDSKPEENDTEIVQVERETAFSEISPIPKPIGKEVLTAYISPPKFPWELEPNRVYGLGNYYVGESCALLPTAMNWPNVNIDHEGLLPTQHQLATEIRQALSGLGYPTRLLVSQRDSESIQMKGGTLVQADITKFTLDSCYQLGERSLRSGQFGSLKARAFKRHRAELLVRWRFFDRDKTTVLYEAEVSGRSNNWLIDSAGQKTVATAFRESFDKLMTDPRAAEYLGRDLGSDSGSDERESIWQKLNPWKKYSDQAKLSSVLADLSRLKIFMVEYYMMEGRWPLDFGEVGLSANDIVAANKEIEDISFLQSGAIEVLLADSFGEGKFLSLAPEFSSGAGMVLWQCQSNLPDETLPETMSCESY